ncbi:hypothetical protein CRG98_042317 [Punica granatum]|uniref:Uncharacterized protein n=1 Tax=Punica granatum TaxID=22663 RepID=A0A2I0I0L1_PUNGR|nr:hypothetical protein CRG98_042317 [Punica granatum]
MLQEARVKWLGELSLQEIKLACVNRPSKVERGQSKVARRTCGAGKKVNSQGLADPGRLQEARARWLGELKVQESKLAWVSLPTKVARGTSEVAQRTCDAGKKVNSQGLADPGRLQEARARWLGELKVQESKLAWVSLPTKVARGTSEVAQRTCDAGKKVNSQGLADPGRLQEARARWLGELKVQESCKRHERGSSANLRCRKVNSQGLADPGRLQEARARWLGELKVQESKLAWVSLPTKVARGTSEVAQRTCDAGKKVNSQGLADPGRLQEARARWLGELKVQESKLAWVSLPTKVARGTSEVAQRTCDAGKKVNSQGLADPGRLQEARARWLGELKVQESCKRHERGSSANLRCRKVNSQGLADPGRLQEARARWLGELKVQESKLAWVSLPTKVARGTSEVAQRTCDAGKKVNSQGLADPGRLQEARARWLGELKVQEINSHGLADPARLQEARARWLGERTMQDSKLARVSKSGKVARGTSEMAR